MQAAQGDGQPAHGDSTVQLQVDGRSVRVARGATLLEAARAAGAQVPTLCYHETLRPIGACRVCVVELEGSRALVPACQRLAEPGMAVHTRSERVLASRRMVVELLESSAKTDLSPEVARLAAALGSCPERWRGLADWEPASIRGPRLDNELYVRDLDRCILCYRCVAVCGEQVQNSFAISVARRGYAARVDPGFDLPLPDSACVFCGNCVAVCPTEALVVRTQFELRRQGLWDPERQRVVRTVCPFCGVGCNLELHLQDGRIVRVGAPADDPITRGYLCVKGRFGWTYVRPGEAMARPATDPGVSDGSADAGGRASCG